MAKPFKLTPGRKAVLQAIAEGAFIERRVGVTVLWSEDGFWKSTIRGAAINVLMAEGMLLEVPNPRPQSRPQSRYHAPVHRYELSHRGWAAANGEQSLLWFDAGILKWVDKAD
jgi:hypothetical protein